MTRVLLAALLLAGATGVSAQERLTTRTVIGTPTVVMPGPGWITAGSDYPTHMVVKWSNVPGATRYRVWRSSSFDGRWLRIDKLASELASPTEPGYSVGGDVITYPTYQASLTASYSYEVQAVFLDVAGNVTYSGMSAAASAVSMPYLAPSNLRWTVQPAADPSILRLVVAWDAIPGAEGYLLTGTNRTARGSYVVPKTMAYRDPKLVFDASQGIAFIDGATLVRMPVRRGDRLDLCLVTWYPNGIRDDNLKGCLTVQL